MGSYATTGVTLRRMVAALGGGPITEYQPEGGPSDWRRSRLSRHRGAALTSVLRDSFGQVQVVGILIALMNGQGVGRPGNWVNDGKSWTWLATPPAPAPVVTGPIFPIPMRPFYHGESVQDVNLGVPAQAGSGDALASCSVTILRLGRIAAGCTAEHLRVRLLPTLAVGGTAKTAKGQVGEWLASAGG